MSTDMKLRLFLCLMAITGFMVLLGIAGRIDHDEHIILTMSQEDYDTIVDRLTIDGEEPSQHEIATYYVNEFNK